MVLSIVICVVLYSLDIYRPIPWKEEEDSPNDGDDTPVVAADGHDEEGGEHDSSRSGNGSRQIAPKKRTRSVVRAIRYDSDDEWPQSETQQKALMKFWGKFKVEKDEDKNDIEESMSHSSDPDPEVPASHSPKDDSDNESSSSEPIPSGSRGEGIVPYKEDILPLCVEHARNLECEGEGCKTCRMVCNDIENGQLHAYDDTASWGSEWSDGRDPINDFEEAIVSKSSAEHMRAMKAEPATTMHTPHCDQPSFFGFPLVPTPPKIEKDVPRMNFAQCCWVYCTCFLVFLWKGLPVSFHEILP